MLFVNESRWAEERERRCGSKKESVTSTRRRSSQMGSYQMTLVVRMNQEAFAWAVMFSW